MTEAGDRSVRRASAFDGITADRQVAGAGSNSARFLFSALVPLLEDGVHQPLRARPRFRS
jgi:hypothetical protein